MLRLSEFIERLELGDKQLNYSFNNVNTDIEHQKLEALKEAILCKVKNGEMEPTFWDECIEFYREKLKNDILKKIGAGMRNKLGMKQS